MGDGKREKRFETSPFSVVPSPLNGGDKICTSRESFCAGDNIIRLNLCINEITALYWIWKHTRHNLIGFVHYRRFFTTDGENILTAGEAKDLLRENDIIVNDCKFGYIALYDRKIMQSGCELAEKVIGMIRKYIAARQPDYLAAFDRVNGSFGVFCYEMLLSIC